MSISSILLFMLVVTAPLTAAYEVPPVPSENAKERVTVVLPRLKQTSSQSGAVSKVEQVTAPEPPEHPSARYYYRSLSEYDKANIRFIIDTLSHHSAIGLMAYRGKLEAVGHRTGKIHPLRYLAYVRSDENLRKMPQHMPFMAWRRFANDFAESLAKEARRGNITEDIIEDFAIRADISRYELDPLVERGQWRELMERLRRP